MATYDHLFIHPLLGAGDAWSGFLVEAAPEVQSAGKTFINIVNEQDDFSSFSKNHPWLFEMPLEAELATPLPENLIAIFSDNPDQSSEHLRNQEAILRQHRNKVALKTGANQKLPGSGAWDYLLIPLQHARTLPQYALLGLSTRTSIVITNVHSHADHEWVKANACTLCSSEFLLNRHQPSKKADMTRLKLLKLLSLLVADADTREIEEIFRQEPKLAYSLLRLVNSAANAPRSPISSFTQAINLLGRRQLQRWLQLLVFADQNQEQGVNPLLQKAATRGRLMELVCDHLSFDESIENRTDAAFMVGTFSLLDVLLNMSIKEILLQLPLPEFVCNALSEHSGPLGLLLKAIVAAESRDLKAASSYLEQLGIHADKHLVAQITALVWANKISSSC